MSRFTSGNVRPTKKGERRPLRDLRRAVTLALFVAAVGKELRKPPGEREWHGEVLGVVPYDLRPPTLSRIRASLWDPESPRWFLPRSFGVGWSPNLARVARALRLRRPQNGGADLG